MSPLFTVAQINETIDRKTQIGMAQNRRSAWVSAQPRRTKSPTLDEAFMSKLLHTHGTVRQADSPSSGFDSASPSRTGAIRPRRLRYCTPMHVPCQRREAIRESREIFRKALSAKGFWRNSRRRLACPSAGGVERIAPGDRSLATSSGAIRSTSTPQWWRVPVWGVCEGYGRPRCRSVGQQDPDDDSRVDVAHQFDVADPGWQDEPQPSTERLFVAGHQFEQGGGGDRARGSG